MGGVVRTVPDAYTSVQQVEDAEERYFDFKNVKKVNAQYKQYVKLKRITKPSR